MKVVDASHTFYGGYLSSFHHGCKKDAGSDGFTIEKDGEVVKETTLENLEASQVKDINIKENTEGTLGLQVTYDDSFETVQTEISIETE